MSPLEVWGGAKEVEVPSSTWVDCTCVKCIAIRKVPPIHSQKKVLNPAASDSLPVSWVIKNIRSPSCYNPKSYLVPLSSKTPPSEMPV